MAEEVQINGTGTAKKRNPVGTFFLMLIPFYSLYWWYQVNREMADLGTARNDPEGLGDNPTTSLLAIFPGGLIIVPAIVSLINGYGRTKRAQEVTTGEVSINGWLLLIMLIVIGPLGYAYWQSELNKAWETRPLLTPGAGEAVPAPSATETAPTEQQPPPPPPQQ
jgi:hypothetical protein